MRAPRKRGMGLKARVRAAMRIRVTMKGRSDEGSVSVRAGQLGNRRSGQLGRHCHCDSCRRACSAPFTSFFGVDRDKVSWQGALSVVATSPDVRRGFFPAAAASFIIKAKNGRMKPISMQPHLPILRSFSRRRIFIGLRKFPGFTSPTSCQNMWAPPMARHRLAKSL